MKGTTPLTGTWSLMNWYNETESGQHLYPLGPNASGYINYSPDGFVFVQLMAADRRLFKESDPFGGTEAEDSAAFKSQITYAGPYEYYGDHVIHRVTQASFPNWVGTEQRRQVRFLDGTLQLSAAEVVFQGQIVTACVEWQRSTA